MRLILPLMLLVLLLPHATFAAPPDQPTAPPSEKQVTLDEVRRLIIKPNNNDTGVTLKSDTVVLQKNTSLYESHPDMGPNQDKKTVGNARVMSISGPGQYVIRRKGARGVDRTPYNAPHLR
ncbi:MAG: hypothetical protein KKF77_11160 [Proteobacteria bacterium]|nr:hypothetical protein [Pseudomonadota bacterium]